LRCGVRRAEAWYQRSARNAPARCTFSPHPSWKLLLGWAATCRHAVRLCRRRRAAGVPRHTGSSRASSQAAAGSRQSQGLPAPGTPPCSTAAVGTPAAVAASLTCVSTGLS
jgi:hypothetical protein